MIDTMGVILTSNADTDLGELTRLRSVAAIPFGGRYRLVDFVLSNLVNSGIVNVGVATEYNYQSLLDHIGSGKPWGLARKQFGLRFLPPFARRIFRCFRPALPAFFGFWVKTGSGSLHRQFSKQECHLSVYPTQRGCRLHHKRGHRNSGCP